GSYNERLLKRHPMSHQGVAADAIASKEGFTREQLDRIGFLSQQRAARAIKEGWFAKSTVPVLDEEGKVVLDREEFPRPNTTMAALAGLKPAFAQIADMVPNKDGTTYRQLINLRYPDLKIEALHHGGTSSGVVDGASAVLLASADYARQHN